MLKSIRLIHLPPVSHDALPRATLSHRFARWLLRRWQAECQRAERKDRFVPYY